MAAEDVDGKVTKIRQEVRRVMMMTAEKSAGQVVQSAPRLSGSSGPSGPPPSKDVPPCTGCLSPLPARTGWTPSSNPQRLHASRPPCSSAGPITIVGAQHPSPSSTSLPHRPPVHHHHTPPFPSSIWTISAGLVSHVLDPLTPTSWSSCAAFKCPIDPLIVPPPTFPSCSTRVSDISSLCPARLLRIIQVPSFRKHENCKVYCSRSHRPSG